MSSADFLNVLSRRLGRSASDFLDVDVEGEFLVVRPKQYLGSELFSEVHEVVREFNGTYVSAGKQSHWRVPLSSLRVGEGQKAVSAPQVGSSVVWVDVNLLLSMPFQARMDNGNLDELAANIGEVGILQPLLVRPKGDNYEIVCGQRRFKAAVLAGLDKVPCIIKEMDDEQAYLAQLTENIQRYDLSDYEKARMLKYLMDKFGWKQKEIAQKIGKSETWVSRHLAILELEKIAHGQLPIESITERQARAILSAPEEKRKEIIEKVKETGEIPSSLKIESEVKESIEEVAPKLPAQPEEESAQKVEAPPEPKRTTELYPCSDCKTNTFHPTFLKDGRVLCPTCLQYAWKTDSR